MPEIRRKVIGVPLSKTLEKGDDGTLLVIGFFTSDSRDEVGDIITRGATERALPKYRQWGNIRYMHQPKPVGKVTRIGTEDGLAWNEVEIKVIDPAAVFEVENGLLQALSVGILVNWEDVELLEDGGWLINDYSLAEISLVDHPANYDAKLQLSIDDATRDKIREFGIGSVLNELGHAEGQKEKAMEEAEKVVTEVVVETPEVEEAVEKSAEATEAPAEEQSEQTETVEAAKAAETEEVTESPEMSQVILNALTGIADALKALTERVDTLKAEKEEPAQAPVAEAQADPESADKIKSLEASVAELKQQIVELSTPVNRAATLPTQEVVVEEPAAPVEEAPKDLRAAVHKFVETNKRKGK